ncbi:MAG: hypothetical protein ACK4MR_01540 [Erythrobacter cryptus]
MNCSQPNRRELLVLAAMLGLAACQTIPAPGFSAAQRKVLERNGFVAGEEGYLLSINNRLLFGYDSSEIEPPKQAMLRDLARQLAEVGISGAAIEGHAAAGGSAGEAVGAALAAVRAVAGVRRAAAGRSAPPRAVRSAPAVRSARP